MPARVLLCDDEVHILRAAQFKLERAGYAVQCAHDGQEAWEAVRRQRPDLVVTDLQMPRLNGFELASRLRADPQTRDLPIIMLTAKGYELNEAEVCGQLGLCALLNKPFSPRELLEMVNRTLAGAPAAQGAASV